MQDLETKCPNCDGTNYACVLCCGTGIAPEVELVQTTGLTELYLVMPKGVGVWDDHDIETVVAYVDEHVVSGVSFDQWRSKELGTFYVTREYDPHYAD
jgi:hypothetical protein